MDTQGTDQENIATQLTGLLNRQGNDLQTRIQQHLSEAKNHENKRLMEEAAAKAKVEEAEAAATQQAHEFLKERLDVPEAPKKTAATAPEQSRKLVYLAYTYNGVPPYVEHLKKALQDVGYLAFNPLGDVEEQFDEEHKQPLFALESKVSAPVCRFLKLPEEVLKPLGDAKIIQALRKGDAKLEVDSMIFKELYFLARSSVMICDLIMEPYGCELYQKLFYAKLFDIPVIGVSPLGRSVSAYAQKYLKVLLTDEFNIENILPLVRAYTS